MRIYYDTEFIERGPSLPIELISVGMVREDGETLYLINADVSISQIARHPWLALNVWPTLPLANPNNNILTWDEEHEDYPRVVGLDTLAAKVLEFVGDEPELWAYYGAYDHVVLAQMYGTMDQLPPSVPMYTNDVVQEWNRQGRPQLPPQLSVQHHALEDALWVKEAHEFLLAREPARVVVPDVSLGTALDGIRSIEVVPELEDDIPEFNLAPLEEKE